ncbi:MAG TPA: hypothetical protein VMZ91_15515 [Candidatus Paceibacterota bacterium]|nr:hypothetical protein [Candidatus Paceibacterota bacterium]
MTDFLRTRQELEARQMKLGILRPPIITKQMMREGLRTRPQRQEIVRYKKDILKQKKSYGKQIGDIDRYLEELKERKDIISESESELIKPIVSLFNHPKLKRTRWF